MKIIKGILIFALAFLLVVAPAVAHEDTNAQKSEETDVNQTAELNSFELFWPLAAGRTRGDSLYFLKRLKEKVRGALIFGKPQKAEYKVFLTTKRVLEAEKLLNEGKSNLVNETLTEALEELEEASKEWFEYLEDGLAGSYDYQSMYNKLANLEHFLPELMENNSEALRLLDKVSLFLTTIKKS